ncbi:MAG: 30S ribosomal protein S2 [Deltaproteobacteria bacterium]|nr:30S ribosomal protein S2 [Deltaproteobacteria bacterium]
MSNIVSVKELLEAGAHFGHQVSRWNPKMRPYIFTTKGGIHIMDLDQTVSALKKAIQFVTGVTALGHQCLFVGTKKQAKPVIESEAKRSGQYFVSNRWLGGMLTNFKTIKASITRLETLEKQMASPDFEKFTKRERLTMEREAAKHESVLGGIKAMTRVPGVVFIIDPKKEEIAKKEANRLKIPVVAIVDTNCNPDGIDYVIPANDDAIRSIQIITGAIADACEEGMRQRQAALAKQEVLPEGEEKPKAFTTERDINEKAKAYVGKDKKEVIIENKEAEKFSSAKVKEGTA